MVKRIVIVALMLLLGVSMAAFAETQNIKVSGDIETMTVFRDHFSLSGKNNPYSTTAYYRGTSDDIWLTIARLRVDADLTDNVSATVRLIAEWLWGTEDNGSSAAWLGTQDSNTEVDIDLAYVTLKEFLYCPLTLVVGRQELHYGNDMIIGDPDTNRWSIKGNIPGDLSKRKAFNAVRAILDYNPLTIDLVYAKINSGWYWNWQGERVGDLKDNDTDLYGTNAKYQFGKWNTVLEGYYWYRRIGPRAFYPSGPGLPPASGAYKADSLHTLGARVSLEPIENLLYQLEFAVQKGRANIDAGFAAGTHVVDRRAWALETMLTYNWKKAKYTPSASVLYAYFTGDSDQWTSLNTDRTQAWDPMFENQTFGHIANALFPQSNVQLLGLQGSMKPREDITLKGEYYYYWFAKKPTAGTWYIGYYLFDGVQMDNKKQLGSELDLTATYDYTEDVQFNLLTGIFWPGAAFADQSSRTATEVIGSVKVIF